MLRILQLEQIESKLLEVPSIIDGYKQNDSSFPESAEIWLRSLETIVSNNRLSTAGVLAGLRGILISVKEGVRPQGIDIIGKPTRKKLRRATATDIMSKAIYAVEAIIQNDRARINEGKRVALSLIAYAVRLNMIEEADLRGGFDVAKRLLRKLRVHESTAEGAVTLESLLGVSDSVICIDRALTYHGRNSDT